jgi:hypothetical protein
MKVMTCSQLGGACDLAFEGETFDEVAGLSKTHGSQMFEQQDQAHLQAMQAMMKMMQEPGAMQAWMADRRQAFEALPDA